MCCSSTFLVRTRPPPRCTLFPYTTLFRSTIGVEAAGQHHLEGVDVPALGGLVKRDVMVVGELVAQRRIPGEQRESGNRSEEHTSELQSPDHLVCRLLLEKKNSTCCSSNPR